MILDELVLKAISINKISLQLLKIKLLILGASTPHIRAKRFGRLHNFGESPSKISQLKVSASDVILLHDLQVVLEYIVNRDTTAKLLRLLLMGFQTLIVNVFVLSYSQNLIVQLGVFLFILFRQGDPQLLVSLHPLNELIYSYRIQIGLA